MPIAAVPSVPSTSSKVADEPFLRSTLYRLRLRWSSSMGANGAAICGGSADMSAVTAAAKLYLADRAT